MDILVGSSFAFIITRIRGLHKLYYIVYNVIEVIYMNEEKKFVYEQLDEQFTEVLQTVKNNQDKLEKDLQQAKDRVKKIKKEIKENEALHKEVEIKSYYYISQESKIDELNNDTTLVKLLNTK